jgi:hypothetical protein
MLQAIITRIALTQLDNVVNFIIYPFRRLSQLFRDNLRTNLYLPVMNNNPSIGEKISVSCVLDFFVDFTLKAGMPLYLIKFFTFKIKIITCMYNYIDMME